MSAPSWRLDRAEGLVVAALVFLGLGLRVALIPTDGVINGDGVYYATLGEHLADGRLRAGVSAYWAPLYPVLVALSSFVISDLETAGRVASAVVGSLVVIPTFLLVRVFFGRAEALIAAALVAIHPSLLESSTWVMTEALYGVLFLTAILVGWRAVQTGAGWWFAAAGAAFGLTYLTRPEAAGFLVLFVVLVIVLGRPLGLVASLGRRAALAATAIAMFVVASAPYLVLAQEEAGHWTISSKLDSNTALGDENEGLRELIRNGRTTRMDELFGSAFAVPHAPPRTSTPGPDRADDGDEGTGNDGFASRVGERLRKQLRDHLRVVLPVPFLLCALVGLLVGMRDRQPWVRHVYLLSFGASSALGYAASVVELRYMFPLIPIAAGYVASGVVWIIRSVRTAAGPNPSARGPRVAAAAAAVVAAVLALSLAPRYDGISGPDELREAAFDEKRAGLWLRDHGTPHPLLMASNATAAFYARGSNVFLPSEPFEVVLDYATRRGVDYWVVSERREDEPPPSTSSMRLVFQEEVEPGFAVHVYELRQ
ncbi:MAG: glycosyltransferase family 39 protein [Actinomycetota bacterium]